MANRKCIVCGSEYSYCPFCFEDRNKPTWMNMFDKQDCKDLFDIGCAFEQGKMSANEAAKKINGKDISNIKSPSLKESIDKIKADKVFTKEDKKEAKVSFDYSKNPEEVKEEKKLEKISEKSNKESEKKFFK